MYFQYSYNVNVIYAVPTAIIELLCSSLECGFCTAKQSMNIINIPVSSVLNFVSCKNKCVEMCFSTLLYIIKVKTGTTILSSFLLTP